MCVVMVGGMRQVRWIRATRRKIFSPKLGPKLQTNLLSLLHFFPLPAPLFAHVCAFPYYIVAEMVTKEPQDETGAAMLKKTQEGFVLPGARGRAKEEPPKSVVQRVGECLLVIECFGFFFFCCCFLKFPILETYVT